MNIITYMVPIALGLGLGFVGLFVWTARSGQYDDLETPAVRILIEDEHETTTNKAVQPENKA